LIRSLTLTNITASTVSPIITDGDGIRILSATPIGGNGVLTMVNESPVTATDGLLITAGTASALNFHLCAARAPGVASLF
jgi:hypothetical protein